ncbi:MULTISPECIES: hypothetical protein [unclassified Pseudoclavibacter]|uniref:hypothetical protein n=1 Tax=unclassified Pseudoclavibacter TaxID=2615177 RepID=UPI001BA81BC7|nr:hypothetical protein [Pseudoclavibacter sp. Marseille-Q4354]MBS3177197.1 hypothetical protein [Pseudoclavibacter sp. Marseille-Q4354]
MNEGRELSDDFVDGLEAMLKFFLISLAVGSILAAVVLGVILGSAAGDALVTYLPVLS